MVFVAIKVMYANFFPVCSFTSVLYRAWSSSHPRYPESTSFGSQGLSAANLTFHDLTNLPYLCRATDAFDRDNPNQAFNTMPHISVSSLTGGMLGALGNGNLSRRHSQSDHYGRACSISVLVCHLFLKNVYSWKLQPDCTVWRQ